MIFPFVVLSRNKVANIMAIAPLMNDADLPPVLRKMNATLVDPKDYPDAIYTQDPSP